MSSWIWNKDKQQQKRLQRTIFCNYYIHRIWALQTCFPSMFDVSTILKLCWSLSLLRPSVTLKAVMNFLLIMHLFHFHFCLDLVFFSGALWATPRQSRRDLLPILIKCVFRIVFIDMTALAFIYSCECTLCNISLWSYHIYKPLRKYTNTKH